LDIRIQMQADLKAAMKARDSSLVAVLRATLGALANAEAVEPLSGPISLTAAAGSTEVARRELSEDEVRAVIERERAELLAAAAEREGLGLPEDAAGLRAQAEVLGSYL
jgi:uncharacterized protein YqeY